MVDTILIDLKALMVEREDCDAGTVEKLKNGLAQGKTQYRALREATDQLRKKVEASTGAQAKRWHLKLGIASYFLGYLGDAIENLEPGRGGAGQLLPRQGAARTPGARRGDEGVRQVPRRPATPPARCSCRKPASCVCAANSTRRGRS